jgi:hypothetical protein
LIISVSFENYGFINKCKTVCLELLVTISTFHYKNKIYFFRRSSFLETFFIDIDKIGSIFIQKNRNKMILVSFKRYDSTAFHECYLFCEYKITKIKLCSEDQFSSLKTQKSLFSVTEIFKLIHYYYFMPYSCISREIKLRNFNKSIIIAVILINYENKINHLLSNAYKSSFYD